MTYILDKMLVNFLAKPGHPNESQYARSEFGSQGTFYHKHRKGTQLLFFLVKYIQQHYVNLFFQKLKMFKVIISISKHGSKSS